MKEFFRVFFSYIRRNTNVIICGAISLIIFIAIFNLYSLPLEPVAYAAVLTAVFIVIVDLLHFFAFYGRHKVLIKLKNSIGIPGYEFPQARDLIERDYQEIIAEIDENRLEIINKKDKSYLDMVDYYTTWAHQIKTPIAAMRLILQTQRSEVNDELLEQLFKTEQYVEMVLQYLRLDELNSDLLFKKYSLDDIVKQAVRKYSTLFIRKKIKLNYEDLNCYVITDEKWLVFVVEQILSNSLKYTSSGEISIYMDANQADTLIIEDTGIGIEAEDMARVFEKGFTGYNGRADKKSTGIGLHLCRQILKKLSHTIEIESEIGKGTKVKIGLQSKEVEFE